MADESNVTCATLGGAIIHLDQRLFVQIPRAACNEVENLHAWEVNQYISPVIIVDVDNLQVPILVYT